MRIECSVISDVGMHRGNNEDNFYINGYIRQDVGDKHNENHMQYDDVPILAAVFDGMGGEENGEIASLRAAQKLGEYQDKGFNDIASDYINEANVCVCNMMEEKIGSRSGSTVSIVYINGKQLQICTVGDSPVFVCHDKKLTKVSVDHNEAQRMIDMGLLTEQEARKSVQKHWLTQHLGIYEEEMLIEPFVKEDIFLEEGDKILLCSDGLTDMVEYEDIESVLCEHMDAHWKVKTLVELALENGGRDNITVILLSVQRG